MNLHSAPFELISVGKKVVEMRLNTPERSQIHKDDHIIFVDRESGKSIEVLVLNIVKFPTFKELYENIDHIKLGYEESNSGNYEDMYQYYKKEDIIRYGVLAIYIRKINNQ